MVTPRNTREDPELEQEQRTNMFNWNPKSLIGAVAVAIAVAACAPAPAPTPTAAPAEPAPAQPQLAAASKPLFIDFYAPW